MAVEKMQFSMPMAGFPFTATQAEKEEAEAFVRVRAEAAIIKAKAEKEKEEAILKAKAEKEKEAAFLKSKAEKEAAFIVKAKAEEAFIVKAKAEEEEEEEDAPYDKVYHDSDAEEDPETIMARIVARWDAYVKEQEARFPTLKYRVYSPEEYSVNDPDEDSHGGGGDDGAVVDGPVLV